MWRPDQDSNLAKGVPAGFVLSRNVPNCLKTSRFLGLSDTGRDGLVEEIGAEVGADFLWTPKLEVVKSPPVLAVPAEADNER